MTCGPGPKLSRQAKSPQPPPILPAHHLSMMGHLALPAPAQSLAALLHIVVQRNVIAYCHHVAHFWCFADQLCNKSAHSFLRLLLRGRSRTESNQRTVCLGSCTQPQSRAAGKSVCCPSRCVALSHVGLLPDSHTRQEWSQLGLLTWHLLPHTGWPAWLAASSITSSGPRDDTRTHAEHPVLPAALQVTAISGTSSKEKEARGFGAHHFLSIDKVAEKSLDVILNTAPG